MNSVASVFGTRLSRRTAMKGMLAASAAGMFVMRGGIGAFAQDAASYPEVVITATEYAFDMPATIESGWIRVTMDNQGMMDHHAMLMRVNDDATLEDLQAALLEPAFEPMFAVSASVGGPIAGPGVAASVIVDLEPGQYIAICVIPDDAGVPHYALGMQATFEVTEGAAAAEAPATALSVELMEMMFHGVPAEVAAGPQVWEVSNPGAQLHELFVGQLMPGVTFDQLSENMFAPPSDATTMAGMDHATPGAAPAGPPFTGVGGVAPMNSGHTNYAVFNLQPGEHFMICFVPDSETGAPHAVLGMMMGFTVA
jgi:hypothetical protein